MSICVLLGNRVGRDTSKHSSPRSSSVRDQRQSPPSCCSAERRLLDSQSRVTSLSPASSRLLLPGSCRPASQEGTSLSPVGKATSLWPAQARRPPRPGCVPPPCTDSGGARAHELGVRDGSLLASGRGHSRSYGETDPQGTRAHRQHRNKQRDLSLRRSGGDERGREGRIVWR